MADKRQKMPRPLAVGDLLSAVLSGTPAEKRLSEGKIWLAWDAAVGETIAKKARPVSFRDGTLTVAVDSAPWMQQLTFLKRDITVKLNERLGAEMVRDIFLKAGRPESAPPAPKPVPPKRIDLSAADRQWLAERLAPLTDPQLREAFERVLARALTERRASGSPGAGLPSGGAPGKKPPRTDS